MFNALSNDDNAKISKYLIRVHDIKQSLYICQFTETPEDARFGFVTPVLRSSWFWRNLVERSRAVSCKTLRAVTIPGKRR